MRIRPIRFASFWAFAVLAVPVLAAEPSEGIPVGPWILAPVIQTSWGYDSNPLYASETENAASERSARHAVGAVATLPFRESRLSLAYRREILRYDRTSLRDDTSDDFAADLRLRFATTDEATLKTTWTRGLTETLRFDPGGETVFRGDPYRFRVLTAGAERSVSGRRGYLARVTREDLTFPESVAAATFFEFRGVRIEAEYREPIGPAAWATLGVESRRYDHFCEDLDPSGLPCPGPAAPFREEKGDAFFAGVRGRVAEDSPYSLRVGWLDLRYSGSTSGGFQGLVGDAEGRLGFGPTAWVEGALFRRAYASFYSGNDYFLYEGLSAGAGLSRRDRWDVACRVLYARGRYEQVGSSSGIGRRADETLRAEAYANLFLPRRFGVRMTLSSEQRTSNDARLAFERRTVLVGFFFGWI